MDVKSMVYNAARDGGLNRLKILLHNKPPEIVKRLISPSFSGATPLVIAAKNGHLDIIEYLITKCCADIEEVGNIDFDGEIIEGVPPLWSASAAGHIDVVKALVRHGAKINSTTKSISTPLRAACYDGHLDIVKYLIAKGANMEIPNQHGHTCLMIACYKGHYRIAKYLLDCGADVNRKSQKGNTALHDCAEYGSLVILKLLLERGAVMVADLYNVTPLLAAAVSGHTAIVEYIISLEIFSIKEKITALELLGATYVDNKRDMSGALELWKRSLNERLRNNCMKNEKDLLVVAAYGNTKEFSTIEELDTIFADPDTMRLQSLIIRERILGPGHPDTTYFIRYRGAVYADNGDFETCIRLWLYALEKQQEIFEPLSTMTQSSLLSFAELFTFMISKTFVNLKFCDILAVYERTFLEVEAYERTRKLNYASSGNESTNGNDNSNTSNGNSGNNNNLKLNSEKQCQKQKHQHVDHALNYHRTLDLLLYLISILSRTRPTLTEDEELTLKRSIHRLIRLDPRDRAGWSLLQLACCNYKSTHSLNLTVDSAEVIKLLLDCGANINALNNEGNTPLHVAVLREPCSKDVIKLLLDSGAHIDVRNNHGLTALNLAGQLSSEAFTEICPLKYINLQCLCAHIIVKNQIQYQNIVDKNLAKFVEDH